MTSLGPSIHGRTTLRMPVALSWRVGGAGRLEVLLELETGAEAGFAPLELHGSWRLERPGSTVSGHVSGSGSLVPVQGGTDVELEAELRLEVETHLEASTTPIIACISIARARSNPVVLTDLPAVLGLPGGTYVLDSDGTAGLPALG